MQALKDLRPRTHDPFGPRDVWGWHRLLDTQMSAAWSRVFPKLPTEAPECAGKGCVIAGGGKYRRWAWATAAWLRENGWPHGIQVWHLGADEIPPPTRPLFHALDVETVNAHDYLPRFPHRSLAGWTLKGYAVMHSPYEDVLFLDADCFAMGNAAQIFHEPEYTATGAIFFRDVKDCRKSGRGYTLLGLREPAKDREWESGQWAVNKRRHWRALSALHWLNEHAEVWWKFGHGDKFTLELAWRATHSPHFLNTELEWKGWGISHRIRGQERFRHVMGAKRGEAELPAEFAALLARYDDAERALVK